MSHLNYKDSAKHAVLAVWGFHLR